jgi:hypothetical protein
MGFRLMRGAKGTRTMPRTVLAAVYLLATVQFAWCYLWLTRAYVNTARYEQGTERMPFQGRMLMMLPLRLAGHSRVLARLAQPFGWSHFWFPRPVAPEVLVQAAIDVGCLLIAGWVTTKIYVASSSRQLLTPLVYPLMLVVCGATYIMHTVQNFRFVYDLPSLAFFAVAMYLMYFQRSWVWFAALFCVATINRETTLLLLPLHAINNAVEDGRFAWRRVLRPRSVALVLPLGVFWIAWQIAVRHIFAHNPSEFYPRINWNLKSLAAPLAWPQLLSANGYLLLLVVALRQRIPDRRLRRGCGFFPSGWASCSSSEF